MFVEYLAAVLSGSLFCLYGLAVLFGLERFR